MKYRVVLYSTENYEVEVEAESAREAVLSAKRRLYDEVGDLDLSEVEAIGEESE